ncbi:hypothetical protein D3C85_863990 [compost metagenome]
MRKIFKLYLTLWVVLFAFLNANAQCETIMRFFKEDMYTSEKLVAFAEKDPQKAFDSWKILYNEKTGLAKNIEELNVVSKNLDEISKSGGYFTWKQKTGSVTDWVTLENKLTSKLSSSIESSTLTKMIYQMKNAGDDGLRLALRIEKGTYENFDGYIKLIKGASVDQHLVKSVNQALDKADDLVSTRINKSLLQFEDNPLGYDIDLGIKTSVGSKSYSEVYQFKTNTASLTKSSIADASKQLYTAPSNKRIIEFRLSQTDNISTIKNNESIIKELKFQLYEKGLKPTNNVLIDEFHLISTSGEKVKVVYHNNNNIEFINF